MKRLLAMIGLACVLALGPGSAPAQSLQDRVVSALQADGYTRITVSRTWLGRTRIVATAPGRTREVVFNPATGVILRDFVAARDGGGGRFDGDDDDAVGGTAGRGGDGDDRDDDDGDDGDDDDGDDGGGDGDDDDGGGDDGGGDDGDDD